MLGGRGANFRKTDQRKAQISCSWPAETVVGNTQSLLVTSVFRSDEKGAGSEDRNSAGNKGQPTTTRRKLGTTVDGTKGKVYWEPIRRSSERAPIPSPLGKRFGKHEESFRSSRGKGSSLPQKFRRAGSNPLRKHVGKESFAIKQGQQQIVAMKRTDGK